MLTQTDCDWSVYLRVLSVSDRTSICSPSTTDHLQSSVDTGVTSGVIIPVRHSQTLPRRYSTTSLGSCGLPLVWYETLSRIVHSVDFCYEINPL